MSQLQRVIVRFGVEADIPALRLAELGWDSDTKTFRVGDNTADPTKVITTKSTGDFDFSSSSLVKFNDLEVNTMNGIDFASLNANPGILVRSTTSGQYTVTSIESSDGSVDIANPQGLNGPIDVRISTQSLRTALAPVIEDIDTIRTQLIDLDGQYSVTVQTVGALNLLSGEPVGATAHADFNRGVIPSGSTTRQALQVLENYAYFVANEGADTLLIQNHSIDDFELALGTGAFVVIPAAAHDKSGLLSGSDKRKLDYLDLSGDIVIAEIGVSSFRADGSLGYIVNSNGNEVEVSLATTSKVGLMSTSDKTKLNNISISTPVDLDAVGSAVVNQGQRLTNAENAIGNINNSTVPNINNQIAQLDAKVNQALTAGDSWAVNGLLSSGEISWNGSTGGIDAFLVKTNVFDRATGPRVFANTGAGSVELLYGNRDISAQTLPQGGQRVDFNLDLVIFKKNGQWYGGYSGMVQHIGPDTGGISFNTVDFARMQIYRANSI